MPVEIKLLDHPETAFLTSDSAYFTTPAPGARSHVLCFVPEPHPRGEVLVRSILTSRGYFKNPDMTASAFDEEGMLQHARRY